MKFNMFGFSMSSPWHTTKHCVIHRGTRLIPKRNESGEIEPGLMCPTCGTSYKEHEAAAEEQMKGKFAGKQETKIISAKKKRKYYDKQGNEINDEQLLKDIANGKVVLYYNEQKSGEDKPVSVRISIV